jgi:hypothetical protein
MTGLCLPAQIWQQVFSTLAGQVDETWKTPFEQHRFDQSDLIGRELSQMSR